MNGFHSFLGFDLVTPLCFVAVFFFLAIVVSLHSGSYHSFVCLVTSPSWALHVHSTRTEHLYPMSINATTSQKKETPAVIL